MRKTSCNCILWDFSRRKIGSMKICWCKQFVFNVHAYAFLLFFFLLKFIEWEHSDYCDLINLCELSQWIQNRSIVLYPIATKRMDNETESKIMKKKVIASLRHQKYDEYSKLNVINANETIAHLTNFIILKSIRHGWQGKKAI